MPRCLEVLEQRELLTTFTVTNTGCPKAVLPANATLTNGTATFSATFEAAGIQSLTAADTASKMITGSQTGILVNAATNNAAALAANAALLENGVVNKSSGNSRGTRSLTRKKLERHRHLDRSPQGRPKSVADIPRSHSVER